MIYSTIFGLLLMGYEVIAVPTCHTEQAHTRYWTHQTATRVYPEIKRIVIYQQGPCQEL